MSCLPNVVSVSGLSILGCSFNFLLIFIFLAIWGDFLVAKSSLFVWAGRIVEVQTITGKLFLSSTNGRSWLRFNACTYNKIVISFFFAKYEALLRKNKD
jgi:hypothetical protein